MSGDESWNDNPLFVVHCVGWKKAEVHPSAVTLCWRSLNNERLFRDVSFKAHQSWCGGL